MGISAAVAALLAWGPSVWAAPRAVVYPVAPTLASVMTVPFLPAALASSLIPAAPGASWTLAPSLALGLPSTSVAPSLALEPAPRAPETSTRERLASASRELAKADGEPAASGAASSRLFDGAQPPRQLELPLELPRSSEPSPEGLPPYLHAAQPQHAEWLASVLREAAATRTGKHVLEQVERLSAAQRRPITVIVEKLRANNGEYVYDWDLVRMNHQYLRKTAAEAAPTLLHELLHVAQRAHGVPVDAFEMELEAYGVTFEVMRELGLPFEKGTFYRDARRKFRGPLGEYVDWLASEYPHNVPLVRSRLSTVVAALRESRDREARRVERLEKKRASVLATVERLARALHEEQALRRYRDEELGKVDAALRETRLSLSWHERDLAILATPEGRERYRRYARRVMDYTRRLHARYNSAG